MNILYIHHSFTVIGGLERILIDRVNYIAERTKHDVWLVTYEQNNKPFCYHLSNKVHYIDLNLQFYLQYKKGFINRIIYLLKLRKKLTNKIAGVISQNLIDVLSATTYDFNILCSIYTLRKKTKIIIESHTYRNHINDWTLYQNNNFMKKRILKFINLRKEIIINQSDLFVTLTNEDSIAWEKVKKSIVIPNFTNKPSNNNYDHETVYKKVIAVGRLSEEKGFDSLIKSWSYVNSYHKDWSLCIYGEGKELDNLLYLIKNLNLEGKVKIFNPIKNIYKVYAESDIFVLSSKYEGFGIVLIEAMSAGLPCVSFNCHAGPSEIITDSEDGFLIENENIEMMAKKICYLIENDDIRSKFGKKALTNAEKFSSENVMAKWIKAFELLEKKDNG